MARFLIEGGSSLHGELIPQGAKNEALQVICATLLTPEKVVISNIPEIIDVLILIDILKKLGAQVERISKGNFSFQSDHINIGYLHSQEYFALAGNLRGSLMIVGPLLARFGIGIIPQPGGDKIGRRRLDTHFRGFESLVAKVTFDGSHSSYRVEGKKLNGCYLLLDEASVTGTANLIMAAVLADGTTTIYNAACEPYLQQLCKLLNSMGAKIILCDPHNATVIGLDKSHNLRATRMSSPDIRAGVALLIAALSAKGISTIEYIEQIDRGYENIELRLNSLGAKIVRQ